LIRFGDVDVFRGIRPAPGGGSFGRSRGNRASHWRNRWTGTSSSSLTSDMVFRFSPVAFMRAIITGRARRGEENDPLARFLLNSQDRRRHNYIGESAVKSDDIRSSYLEFFRQRRPCGRTKRQPHSGQRSHAFVFERRLVQFQTILPSGEVPVPYRRANDLAEMLRAGAKANDLDEVGRNHAALGRSSRCWAISRLSNRPPRSSSGKHRTQMRSGFSFMTTVEYSTPTRWRHA